MAARVLLLERDIQSCSCVCLLQRNFEPNLCFSTCTLLLLFSAQKNIERASEVVEIYSNVFEAYVPMSLGAWTLISPPAVVAQAEHKMISQRTKAALRAAKARGVKLGAPDPSKGGTVGVARIKEQAGERASALAPVIEEIRAAGITSLAGLARALNARGVTTPRGGKWYPTSVKNVIERVSS